MKSIVYDGERINIIEEQKVGEKYPERVPFSFQQ